MRRGRPSSLIPRAVCGAAVLSAVCGAGRPAVAGPPTASTSRLPADSVRSLDEWRARMKQIDPRSAIDDETLAGLRQLIVEPSVPWFTRRQAALLLGRIGAPAAAAVPDLIRILDEQPGDDEPSARLWAMKALAFFGPSGRQATPRIVQLFQDPAQPLLLRETATEALGRIGGAHPDAIPPLIAVAREGDLRIAPADSLELRITSIEALELCAPSLALPTLMAACEDPSERVRRAAATTIGAMGPGAAVAIETLATLIVFDDETTVRDAAGRALPRIGQSAAPALRQLIGHERPDVRRIAAAGLAALGAGDRQSIAVLCGHVEDPEPEVAVAAARALWSLTLDAAPLLNPLLAALDGQQRDACKQASDLLIEMGRPVASIRPELVRMASSGPPRARIAAQRVLDRLDDSASP